MTDPAARLRRALVELYAYFRRGEPMLTSAARDLPQVPTLAKVVAELQTDYWELVSNTLVAGWEREQVRPEVVRAAIGHVTAFSTWQALVRAHGLNDDEAVDLMVCLVSCAAGAHCSNATIAASD